MAASKTQFKGLGKGTSAIPGKTVDGGKGATKDVNAADNKVKNSTLGNTLGKSGTQALVQVIYNGKIVTPQSLLPKRTNKGAVSSTINNTVVADNNSKSPATMSRKKLSVSSSDVDMKHSSTRHSSVNNMSHARSTRRRNNEEETIQVILSETNTNFVFSLKSMVVAADSRDINVYDERNTRYENLIADHKNASDNFKARPVQTINYFQRNKNESTSSSSYNECGTQALCFDITDATGSGKKQQEDIGVGTDTLQDDEAGLTHGIRKFVNDNIAITTVTPGILLDTTDTSKPIGPSEVSKAEKKNKNNTHTNLIDDEVNENIEGVTVDITSTNSSDILLSKKNESILSSKLLLSRLLMLERAVQQNAYHRNQLDYQSLNDIPAIKLLREKLHAADANDGVGGFGFGNRRSMIGSVPVAVKKEESVSNNNIEEVTHDVEDGEKKKVKKLFSFYNSHLVDGRAVTSMAWNAVNNDLLAVAYGKYDAFLDTTKLGDYIDEKRNGGLVLFWSLRNPDYPEKILRTPFPVTSLEFSKLNPMILAVGLLNGDINIYDIRRENDYEIPVESSAGMSIGHSDPVWEVKWTTKGVERFETLVSISTDGKVLEWNMKKGFIGKTLMQLSRAGTSEGWISRQAAGLCISFPINDPNLYVVGTEEGTIHKCSTSYSEQYLDTYGGHEGPVYKVKFSPRWPSCFISCSADWQLGLYHMNLKNPLLKMRASGEDFSINDVSWCPGNSTVFAAVTSDAKLQIWDLSVSAIDPVVSYDSSVDDIAKKQQDEKDAIESAKKAEIEAAQLAHNLAHGIPTIPVYARLTEKKEEVTDTPATKILKNLSKENKRVLTTSLFSESAPIVVVGDNKGAVTIYRVIDPVTITNEGPLQQLSKLKNAVIRLSDPATASKIDESSVSNQ